MVVAYIAIAVVVAAVCGASGAAIAAYLGRHPGLGFLCGLLLGPLGWPLVLVLPSRNSQSGGQSLAAAIHLRGKPSGRDCRNCGIEMYARRDEYGTIYECPLCARIDVS